MFILYKTNKKKVKLSLEENTIGQIELWATDKDGKQWVIMTFQNGEFRRETDIPKNAGIAVDDKGRIMEGK